MLTNILEPLVQEQQLLLTLTAIAAETDKGRNARAAATAHRRSGSPDHCVYSVTRESVVISQQVVWVGLSPELPADIVKAAYDFGPIGNFWDGADALCINHTTVGTLRQMGRATGRLNGLSHKEHPEMEIYLSWEWLNRNGTRRCENDSETEINLQEVTL